jgi:hypothetical protein
VCRYECVGMSVKVVGYTWLGIRGWIYMCGSRCECYTHRCCFLVS